VRDRYRFSHWLFHFFSAERLRNSAGGSVPVPRASSASATATSAQLLWKRPLLWRLRRERKVRRHLRGSRPTVSVIEPAPAGIDIRRVTLC